MNFQKFTTFKTILIALVLTINANQLFAQTTNGIFFQAVARDNFSNPAKDRKIFVQSSIIQTTPTGTKVLTEEHQANTDATGVFSISLGNGVRVGGTASSLTTIDWSKGPFYLNLKVAITPIGGNSNWDYNKEWVDMGTTSFGAVPFALYSASSAKVDDKLNVSDTTTMLKVYAKAMSVQSLETAVASKLTAADTLTMLKPYAKAAYTIDSSFFKSQLATKLSIGDTILYTKQKYTDSAISKKLNISDSTIYVTPAQLAAKTFDQTPITNAINTKLNIADSTIYVTPTQLATKTFDTTSLSNRINLKANTADVNTAINLKANTADVTTAISAEAATARAAELALTNNVASNTASITANALAIANESTTARAAELTLTNNVASNTSSITANVAAITSEAATARAAELTLTNNVASNTASITANVSAINLKAPIASPLFTGTVGIGTSNPSSAAALDITSTTQGLLLPRLNYVQKTAISNPVAGLVLWCTDCGSNGEMQVYNGTAFVNIVGGPAQFALPTVSLTSPATAITSSALTSGGSIESDGGAYVTVRGVVWNTSPNPTVSFSTKTTDGTGIGNFSSSITGLTSGITYYIRAYATNSEGTKYGPEITVNTAQAVATLAATTTVSSIGATTATSGGNITYNGGATVTTSGLVWSTSSNPTIALSTKTTDGAATGAFTSNITGLTPGTLYYVRSYATNIVGTSYGAQISFTTLNTPTVSATTAGATITSSSASSGGTITSDGGAEITSRGIVYGTSTNSYTYTVTTGTGTGTYTSSMSGLSPATTYYVKAFATNSVGTVYGPEINFTTIAIAPSITTNAASSVTKYAATSGGIITSNGGSAISASGICWSSNNTTPTISDSKTTDGTTSGTFTSTLTGLTAGTTYYVRAYAINGIGTSYGSVQNFTTSSSSSANPVLVSTTTASGISSTTATTGGNVTDEGSTQVSVRGLVYGTTTGSSTYSVTVGSGAGTFTSTLTGLSQGTKYFVRSFATNTQGTGYGAETSFTTQTTPTVSVTATPSSLTTTSAVGGGTISSSGGATITVSGLVWDTNVNPSISLSTKTTDGATSGTFTSSITGLTQGATYHVRAYATNIIGTSYGPDITFTTLTTPTVSATASVTSITGTTATGGGTITSDGGAAVTSRGVVYGTSAGSATYSVTSGMGTGTYTSSLIGLLPATTYFVRSFAINSVGTVYGAETSFITNAIAPTLTTAAVSSINKYDAIAGGAILSNGGSVITASGICWSTTATPTISNSKTTDGTTSGTFTSSINGLTVGTIYYVRAYATNAIGTSYGATQSFTTLGTFSVLPSIGSSYGGGIVAYIYQNGDPGYTSSNIPVLISSNSNQGVSRWFNGSSITTGATSAALGSGFANTNTIIAVQGAVASSYAAGIARAYTDGTYTDWYLPSQEELNKLYINRSAIGGFDGTMNYFWSSTESSSSTAKMQNYLSSGAITDFSKSASGGYIRAVRTINLTSPNIPVLASTATANSITSSSAILGGNVTDEGATQVNVKGFVYGTSAGSSTYSVTIGTGAGTFTTTLTGLVQGTTYYVRSFATNLQGTGYGAETSFTTQTTPTVSVTAAPTLLTTTSAVGGGTISSSGGATITVSGLVWDANVNPSISLSTKTTDGTTSGTFTSSITGLTQGATYHVRAYATNIIGTSYGPDITFTTLTTPTVSVTASVTSITGTTATGGGTISSDGGASITARGIVYGTSTNSYTYTVTSGTGTYTSSLTGLTPATTYFVRAFATNSIGTVYGTEINFTTLAVIPTLASTETATSITTTTALSGGNITDNGGAVVTISGIVWSTTSTPTIALSTKTTDGTSTGTYTSSLTGLTAATTYYVRSYATNSVGTNYGTQTSFTTLAQAPIVSATATPTSITLTSAVIGGSVSQDGIPTATRGLVYGTSSGASTYSVTVGSGAGTYTTTITGLTAGTTYFVRAFASNSLGIVYATDEKSFTTLENIPGTVVIGTQRWKDANLDISTYRNGDNITYAANATDWNNATSAGLGVWCYYNFDAANNAVYGKLYNWYAVNDSRGLAPLGYHVPTETEWDTFLSYLGGNPGAGGKIKTTGTSLWASPNTGATNSSGFNGLPGGYTFSGGFYSTATAVGFWWSASQYSSSRAWTYNVSNADSNIRKSDNDKNFGFSVRLIKD